MQEFDSDPFILIILNDEATLGNVLGVAHSPIQPLQQRPPPARPNTAAVRAWFRGLVLGFVGAPATVVEPTFLEDPMLVHVIGTFIHVYFAGNVSL